MVPKLKRKYLENNRLDTKCYQCPEDKPAFPSWSALEDHYSTRHLKDPKHKCDYEGCNKVFGNRQSLKKHQKLHQVRESRVLKCTFKATCHFQCTKQAELDLHMKKHTSATRFYCDKHEDCLKANKSFSKKVDLNQYLLSCMIDRKEASRVQCIECYKGFKSTKYLEDHIKREHFEGPCETCDICSNELRDQQARHQPRIKHQKELQTDDKM